MKFKEGMNERIQVESLHVILGKRNPVHGRFSVSPEGIVHPCRFLVFGAHKMVLRGYYQPCAPGLLLVVLRALCSARGESQASCPQSLHSGLLKSLQPHFSLRKKEKNQGWRDGAGAEAFASHADNTSLIGGTAQGPRENHQE